MPESHDWCTFREYQLINLLFMQSPSLLSTSGLFVDALDRCPIFRGSIGTLAKEASG